MQYKLYMAFNGHDEKLAVDVSFAEAFEMVKKITDKKK